MLASSSGLTRQSGSRRLLPPVTVEAPREARAKPAAHRDRRDSDPRRAGRQARPSCAELRLGARHRTGPLPPAQRAHSLNQAPAGQTATTIDRSQFDNRPAFSVADVLRDSPGISIKQGNGPRDFGISIRGSNARNGFGIRNMVIFDDGFPVTQPDGLSRSDLIDPHAYGAIDVIRGPSSALYGNYATGGALNFRTRPGGEIDGVEYGVDGGSFGYLNNYLAAGKKVGNFEGSLFASDARGDGYISNSWFNTQTVNFLGTLQATPDDRFTVKFINNDLGTRLPIRLVAQPVLPESVPAGLRHRRYGRARLRHGDAVQQRLQRSRRDRQGDGGAGRARPQRPPRPSSAGAGSMISTTRRPGATSSCSTTGTSTSRPERPARSAISRRTIS